MLEYYVLVVIRYEFVQNEKTWNTPINSFGMFII